MAGLGIEISLRGDAPESVQALKAGLAPARLQPIVGRAAHQVYRKHLVGLNSARPNALGGTRTNFYTSAARGTQFRIQGDYVIVSINQVGIALRYFGGTVRPKVKKFLTIPARAEAHGKRASEFDLVVLWNRTGPYALARRRDLRAGLARDFVGPGRGRGAEVLFWLVKEVTQRADPTVLPDQLEVESAAAAAVNAYAQLLWARKNPGPQNPGPAAN